MDYKDSLDDYESLNGLVIGVDGIKDYSIDYTNNLSCFNLIPGVPFLLYRALRTDELENLLKTGKILSPCNPCPNGPNNCCSITASQHVTSGSKAKIKSNWISTTKSVAVAALWSSAKQSTRGNIVRLNGKSSSGVFAVINPLGLELYNPITDSNIGITGRNAAQASQELLVKDDIPWHNIIGFCQSEQVPVSVYNEWPGGKVQGKRTKESSKINVIWMGIDRPPDDYFEKLSKASNIGLKNRFESVGRVTFNGGLKKSKSKSKSKTKSKSKSKTKKKLKIKKY